MYIDIEIARQRAVAFAAGGGNLSVYGFGVSTAQSVREIADADGARALCVVDNGLEDDPSHALITKSGNQNRASVKPIREKLLELFSPVKTIEETFQHRL